MVTFAPWASSDSTIPRPIPVDPPVTMAVRPVRSNADSARDAGAALLLAPTLVVSSVFRVSAALLLVAPVVLLLAVSAPAGLVLALPAPTALLLVPEVLGELLMVLVVFMVRPFLVSVVLCPGVNRHLCNWGFSGPLTG